MPRIPRIMLVTLACILLGSCAGSARTATYRVDGPAGTTVVVRYRIPGSDERQESVQLPWSAPITYTPGQQLALTADTTSHAGQITCAIVLADQTTPATSNSGDDQANCSITP